MNEEEDCIASGQIVSARSLSQMASDLRALGLHTQVRESYHYTEGSYLLVESGEALYKIEKVEEEELLARGEGESVQEMRELSLALTAALSQLGMKHRLEVYDHNDELVQYCHHDWPRN